VGSPVYCDPAAARSTIYDYGSQGFRFRIANFRFQQATVPGSAPEFPGQILHASSPNDLRAWIARGEGIDDWTPIAPARLPAKPAASTWARGEQAAFRDAASGAVTGWACTAAGTGNAFDGVVTAAPVSGQATVPVSGASDDVAKLAVGVWIKIATVDGEAAKRVTARSGNVLTLTPPPGLLGGGPYAVEFVPPTFAPLHPAGDDVAGVGGGYQEKMNGRRRWTDANGAPRTRLLAAGDPGSDLDGDLIEARVGAYALGTTTFGVAEGTTRLRLFNASVIAIQTITGATDGQTLELTFDDANTIIAHSDVANGILLPGALSFTSVANASLILQYRGGTVNRWVEIARSRRLLIRQAAVPLRTLSPPTLMKDPLADAPGGSALGLADAPGAVVISSGTNNTAVTQEARWLWPVPPDRLATTALQVILRARATNARFVAQTIAAQLQRTTDTGLGPNLVTTGAQTLPTGSFADLAFAVDGAAVVAGDVLVGTVTIALDDTGGSINGRGEVARVAMAYGAFD
jgi:hypothetical protein